MNSRSAAAVSDRFIALPENRSAVEAIQQLVINPLGGSFPSLFLHGPPGTGKSHLLREFAARLVAARPDRTIQSIPAVDLGRLLVDPEGNDERQNLKQCDVLIVEDLQHLRPEAAEGVALLLDNRAAHRRCLVGTAHVGPAELHLPHRLTSRLAAGLVVRMEALAAGSRRELAEVICTERGIRITPAVLDWLASQTGGIRPILGAIHRLERLALSLPPPLDLPVVVANLGKEPAEDQSPLERIAERVASRFGIGVRQLRGKSRHRTTLWARQVAIYLSRQMTPLSLVRIGAFFGGRDHSTVLHACRKVEETLEKDHNLAVELRRIQTELG